MLLIIVQSHPRTWPVWLRRPLTSSPEHFDELA